MARQRRAPPPALAALGLTAANLFQELGVSAAMRTGGPWTLKDGGWRAIHVASQSVSELELVHGLELERSNYNLRCMNRALVEQTLVAAEHAGFSDLFLPIVQGGRAQAVLAVGSFARSRPTSEAITARWQWLTRRQAHPSDPEFAYYLDATLNTLVLEGAAARDFEGYLRRLVRLLAGEGPGDSLLAEMDDLRQRLQGTRSARHAWTVAGSMIDERLARGWSSPQRRLTLEEFGMSRMADHVAVGLLTARQASADPVDEVLRRDAFQRGTVELARAAGQAISGRVGDFGVVFLMVSGSTARARARDASRLATRAQALAKRLGFSLHVGTSPLPARAPITEHYQMALRNAERATGGLEVRAEPERGEPEPALLLRLRRELALIAEERPSELSASFERYLQTVALRSGYELGACKAQLEAAFEHVLWALLEARIFEPKAALRIGEELDRRARAAQTVSESFELYRRAVADLAAARRAPTLARHEAGMQRALEYMQRHYTEPLRRDALARLSGFAPNYFSELFRKQQGVTFESHLLKLRLDRARQLLSTTDLRLQRIAELSGFGSRFHLARQFRRHVGTTPHAWREVSESLPKKPRARRSPRLR